MTKIRYLECQKKQKKSSDQRAPVTRYWQIKELRSLDMKYSVSGRSTFISAFESYDDLCYFFPCRESIERQFIQLLQYDPIF